MDDPRGSTFFARIALEWRLIRPEQLEQCLQEQERARTRGHEILLGRLLLDHGWIAQADLDRILAEQRLRLESSPGLTRYELRERVGEGSTAVVYNAWDRDLQRPVALKLLREEVTLDPVGRERFRREIEAVTRLDHPNVVKLYDAGEAGGRPFLVMELVRGRPLTHYLQRRALDEREAVAIVGKVSRGVGAAHAQGVVHRDLKPANILVLPLGEPKVADFGLARLQDARAGITRAGSALGTPMYMAPEQVSAKATGPWTDVYALGVILYEALTGSPPHVGRNDMEVYRRTMLDATAPPVTKDPRVGALVMRALEKDGARRPPDATALAEELGGL